MNAEQIVEYARREGFRLVPTEEVVTGAVARLPAPFTCRDLVEALPRDSRGRTVSEYLAALWIAELCRRGQIRRTDARWPRIYGPCTYKVSP
jgi:hypothetical protein